MLERSALPQNYSRDSGTLWQNFEDIVDWTCGAGSIENNTSQYHTGAQSIKLVPSVPGGTVNLYREFSPSLDFGAIHKCIEIWIYPHTDPGTTITNITLYFYTESDYYSVVLYGTEIYPDKWNRFLVPATRWSSSGSPDWSDITKFTIALSSASGQTPNISVDSLYYGLEQEGRVLITFDDAHGSVYDYAYPIMSDRGIKGTVYVIAGRIDTGTYYMITSELDTIYNAGWALANHSYTHSAYDGGFLTDLTLTEIEAELRNCRVWLDDRGYTRASKHVAYPGNSYNADVLTAMSNLGMLTGRAGSYRQLGLPVDDHFLRGISLKDTLSLAEAKAVVDRSVDYGTTEVFYGHAIAEVAGGGTWAIADLTALADYIVERHAIVVTINEWFKGLTNPRYTSTPPSRASR